MSFGSPESNKAEQDLGDLDFTKSIDTANPDVKIAEQRALIAAVDRGIALAAKLNDPGRIADLQAKRSGFEATIAEIEASEFKAEEPQQQPANRFDVADMSDITTQRLDARGNI